MRNHKQGKKILPLAVLAESRRCLIVGGGKVAARKVRTLIQAGADVTVVSLEASRDIEKLAETNQLSLIRRPFAEADLRNTFIVFAASDDSGLNAEVLRLCREKNILCGVVDKGWEDGDFISPASFAHDGLTVSVSTGGHSCRRSRFIRDNLSRHVTMADKADLLVLGTDHNHLPLETRERYHLTGEKRAQAGEMVMQVWGVHEFVLLNTCNRIELVAVSTPVRGVENTLIRILGFDHLKAGSYYVKWGMDAFAHLAKVTAGLLSQIPGENHIASQVKEALDSAKASGWASAIMHDWIGSALCVSKEIRRVTKPLLHPNEVEDLCLRLLETRFHRLGEKRVLLIGTGTVGVGLVERLAKKRVPVTWLYHANCPAVPPGADECVKVCSLDDIGKHLPSAGIVICAISGSTPVLCKHHAPALDQQDRVLVLDLSVPRAVAPEIADMCHNVEIVNLDDLKHWYRREIADLDAVHELGDKVVNKHVNLYEGIITSLKGWNEK